VEAVNELQPLAGRVSQGAPVSEEDVRLLLSSHDLIAVGMLADEVRRTLHGERTTFVRVFEVPVEGVPDALPAGVAAGEVRIAGRPASAEAASRAVAQARRLASRTVLTGFSLADLIALDGPGGDVFARLKAVGLDAIAEVPVDRVHPDEVAAARAGGLDTPRLTVAGPPSDPAALLERADAMLASAPGFRVFAPLPRATPASAPTTGYDDVRMVAAARIRLRRVPSIQVDWPLYGPKLAQVALTFGADDVDGIAASDPGTLGSRRSAIEEIRRNIRAAGREPFERDGRFRLCEPAAAAAEPQG
jgi:hypothetical protein